MVYPETYVPPHMRLRLEFRIVRFIFVSPVLLLMAVALLNAGDSKRAKEICQDRIMCM